jgi:hypothetical protein
MNIEKNNSLCIYKNILGIPKKGIHSYRIFDIAIVDVILTIFGAYIIYFLLNYFGIKYNFYIILLLLFILGIILHRIFCVKTTIDKLLTF